MPKNIINERNMCDCRQWVYRDLYSYRGKGKECIKISRKIEKMYKKFNCFLNKNRFYFALLLSTLDVVKVEREYCICFNERKVMDFKDIVGLYMYYYGGKN